MINADGDAPLTMEYTADGATSLTMESRSLHEKLVDLEDAGVKYDFSEQACKHADAVMGRKLKQVGRSVMRAPRLEPVTIGG